MPNSDEIDMKEWGRVMQMVEGLVDTVKEMRVEVKEIRAAVGTRCSDCSLGDGIKTLWGKVDKIEERLRFLEIKVAGIAVLAGIASTLISHVLTEALK